MSRIKNKQTALLSILPLLVGILVTILYGCVDNKYIVDDQRATNLSNTKYIVYFLPRIESNISTRTLTPFPQYCKAQIFAFSSDGNQQSIISPVYRSQEAGTLSPTNTPMTLIDGEYDFYAISVKEDSLPPSFKDNVASDLYNNKDYLWCVVSNQTIDQNAITIPITFNHVATQIIVNIINKDSINPASQIVYATYSPPVISDSVTWSLLTGVIVPATSVSSIQDSMSIDSFTTSCVMIPLSAKADSLSYQSYIQQENGEYQLCQVNIPVPEDGYEAGHSYEYDMIFDADSLMLGYVRVAAWNEVTVSTDVEAD